MKYLQSTFQNAHVVLTVFRLKLQTLHLGSTQKPTRNCTDFNGFFFIAELLPGCCTAVSS